MNSTSSGAAAKARQIKTGLRRSARFGKSRRDIRTLRKGSTETLDVKCDKRN